METEYYAKGFITFHGIVGKQHDPELLLLLVQGADSVHPWRICGGSGVGSRFERSETIFKLHKPGAEDSRCTIEFRPQNPMLIARQIDAYRIYVDTLAEVLAERKMENIIGVHARAMFEYLGRTFETPFARERRTPEIHVG